MEPALIVHSTTPVETDTPLTRNYQDRYNFVGRKHDCGQHQTSGRDGSPKPSFLPSQFTSTQERAAPWGNETDG